ncbi:MAG: hypothetical protein ACUVXI_15450 [bacterium]
MSKNLVCTFRVCLIALFTSIAPGVALCQQDGVRLGFGAWVGYSRMPRDPVEMGNMRDENLYEVVAWPVLTPQVALGRFTSFRFDLPLIDTFLLLPQWALVLRGYDAMVLSKFHDTFPGDFAVPYVGSGGTVMVFVNYAGGFKSPKVWLGIPAVVGLEFPLSGEISLALEGKSGIMLAPPTGWYGYAFGLEVHYWRDINRFPWGF